MRRVIIEKKPLYEPKKQPVVQSVNSRNYEMLEQQIKNMVKEATPTQPSKSTEPMKSTQEDGNLLSKNNAYNFEAFTRGGLQKYQFSQRIFISIYKNGAVSLSTPFVRALKSEKVNYINLFYDKNTMCVGFKFTNNKNTPDIYKLTEDTNSCRSFCPKAFFHHYKLDLNKLSGQYDAKKEHINGLGDMWVVDLKKHA